REVQISEERVPGVKHRDLARLRLLDLDDELGRLEHAGRVGHDLAASLPVLGVVVTRARAGVPLDEDPLAALHELPRSRRQQRDAMFFLFDLFGNADGHRRHRERRGGIVCLADRFRNTGAYWTSSGASDRPQALLDRDRRMPASELRRALEGPREGEDIRIAVAPPDDL